MNENVTNEIMENNEELSEMEREDGLSTGSVVLIAGLTYIGMKLIGKGVRYLTGVVKQMNANRKKKSEEEHEDIESLSEEVNDN